MEKKLSEFKIGEKGKIKTISCEGEIKRRMADVGLLPGITVELKRIAPLGDPLELSIQGYRLAVRKQEASLIVVEVQI